MQYLTLTAVTARDGSATSVEAVIWGVIGIFFVGAVIWAIVSRVRQERKEQYEDRDN